MFSQSIEQIVKRSEEELSSFKKVPVKNYKRDGLIELYWKFHPRFKSFKVLPAENGNVLDIGSGPGGLFFWKEYSQPNRRDLKLTGVDLHKGEHINKYEHFSILNLDHDDLPFAPESFDFIILSHLIEHVQDWRALIVKCHNVLKQNGTIYIETPSKHTIHLQKKEYYVDKGFPCTTINFFDDHTHVATVDLDEVNTHANTTNLVAIEKGFCKNPFLENIMLSFGNIHKDIEVAQYGLWSKLLFSSYIILQKL